MPAADDGASSARAAQALERELAASLPGFAVTVGPQPPHAATRSTSTGPGKEALLAANVAEAEGLALLAFEDTGAYRLLLPAMSEDPGELERFYEETVAPLAAYDEQYETDLVATSRGLPGERRQRRRDRRAAVHPPPHGPLPAGAGQGALRPRHLLDRGPREARASA